MMGEHSMELVFPQSTYSEMFFKLYSEKENIFKHCCALSQASYTLTTQFFLEEFSSLL